MIQAHDAPDVLVVGGRSGLNEPESVAYFCGELDFCDRERVDAVLTPLACERHAAIDLHHVTYAGATLLNGVAALQRKRRARFEDEPLRIIGASPIVRRLFAVSDLAGSVCFLDSRRRAGLAKRPIGGRACASISATQTAPLD